MLSPSGQAASTSFYHTQDYDFQKQTGLHSIASRFGVVGAFWWARVMDGLALIALIVLGVWLAIGWPYYIGIALAAGFLICKHRLVSPDDLSSLGMAFFRINAYVSTTHVHGNPHSGADMNRHQAPGQLRSTHPATHPVVVGISGASGSAIANGVIDALLDMDRPVIATASSAARMVWQQEMDTSFGEALEQWQDAGDFTFYAPGDIQAPIASGTFPVHGMAIVPCSMSTVAALAHGFSDNLIRRAADVCIKERRPLTIVPRETPTQRHTP